MIIEFHALNALLVHKHFKMSTAMCVMAAILVPMWGSTLYFQNAYLTVPMAVCCQINLGLQLELTPGILKNIRPFQSPFLFNRIMTLIKVHLVFKGIQNSRYLEDLIFLDKSPEGLVRKLEYIRQLPGKLQLSINFIKVGTNTLSENVFENAFQSRNSLFFSTRRENSKSQVQGILCTEITMVNPQEVGRTHGFLNFLADFIHLKRLHLSLLILWQNLYMSPMQTNHRVSQSSYIKAMLKVWLNDDLLHSQSFMKPNL